MQPLRGEVVDERPRSRVGQHAPDLPLEDRRLVQLAGDRHVQQLIVRNAAPQEEREPRRQLEIADAIRRVRRDAGRIGLESEEEVRAHQHARQRHLDAGVEAASARPFSKSASGPRRSAAVTGRRYARFISAVRICRAARSSSSPGPAGLRAEYPAAAGSVAGTLRAIGTDDRNRVDGRLDPRMPVVVEVRLVGLTRGLEQQRRLLQKCHAERVRARLHRHADLEVLIDRRMLRLALRRLHGEHLHPRLVQQQLEVVRLGQALDVLVAVAHQPNLDLVLAVHRETCSRRPRRRASRSAAPRGALPG